MIKFNCPSCNLQISVPDQAAGRTGTCPRCHTKTRVPDQELPAAPLQGVPVGEVPAPMASAAPATGPAQAQISCPFCAEKIPANAKKCRFCGEQVQISCPSCAELIPANAKKCRFCGEPLETATNPAPSRRPAPPRPVGRRETDVVDDVEEEYAPRSAPARRSVPRGHCPKDEWDKTILDYLTEYCGGKLLATKGRATRREFWTCFLAGIPFVALVTYLTIGAIAALLVTFFGLESLNKWFYRHPGQVKVLPFSFVIPMAVPFATLCARRWQDAGINGVVGFIPIGWLGVFILLCTFTNDMDIDFFRVCLFLTAVAIAAIVACGLIPGKEGRNAYGSDRYDPDSDR